MADRTITLNHGAGGRAMNELIRGLIHSTLGDSATGSTEDSAVIAPGGAVAFTSDSYVVSPLFFPGGDIGRLAVAGTCNDLATSGAVPRALSLSLILEEGFEIDELRRVLESVASTAREAGVQIVTGDTKVVPSGKVDGLFINTAGIGVFPQGREPLSSDRVAPGQIVYCTGPLGDHELALMSARGTLPFDISVTSDAAPLGRQIDNLLSAGAAIMVAKDATRGGAASVLHELAEYSGTRIVLEEDAVPLRPDTRAVCELAGFDPLYLANEGTMVLIGEPGLETALRAEFPEAVAIGKVEDGETGLVLETPLGGIRRLGMLETVQLPRIC